MIRFFFGILAAFLLFADPAFAQQAPRVIGTSPANNARRVPPNAQIKFIFDRPTGKVASYSIAPDTSTGGTTTTLPNIWSARGDTLTITPFEPLAIGHTYIYKLNALQDTTGAQYNNPAYYEDIYTFSVISRAFVERVQSGNLSLSLAPDATLPATIPVRETAGTDVSFPTARVQFLSSPFITNSGSIPLDTSATPFYEYTVPIGAFLPRYGAAPLTAPVLIPASVARTIPQGMLGVRLTFYGQDELSTPIVIDACYRVDPTSVVCHQATVLPAMATDVLIRSAALEWPLHGAVIAAGDTIVPRAVVVGNGTGPFRAGFYMDGDLISIEEGYMEAGRPVTVTMRGPLPTRRLGEHRLQFQVESPQPLSANPISFVCAPLPNGVSPLKAPFMQPPTSTPVTIPYSPVRGSLTWLADGRPGFRGEDKSAVGWGSWEGFYDLGPMSQRPMRQLQASVSMRLRFDETGNGSGKPQHLKLRYTDPHGSLEWSDAPPVGANEMPLLMSPVPRRSAQAALPRTPLGSLDGYVALASRPISAAGPTRAEADLYAARLVRSWLRDKVVTTFYGGYTHEKSGPSYFGALFGSGGVVHRSVTYGATGRFDLPGTWTLLADGATVRHRATAGVEEGRSRTAWRGELQGAAAGFQAQAQAFSYQPALQTALNPYALSDRRGGFARLDRAIWKWNPFVSFRSEEPASREGLIPVVRVQTGTVGARLKMSEDSWVTPSVVRVTHRGANTEFTEHRLATDYTVAEMGGRTTARFDITYLDDPMRGGAKRRVISGSVVSTRRHPGRVVSTTTFGVEQNHSRVVNLTDMTIQGSFEARWEAIAGRLLVTPFFSGASRSYDLQGYRDEHYTGRLQIAFLRIPHMGENAVSLEGRIDRLRQTQTTTVRLDESVQLTIGQRFSIGGM